MVCDVMLQEFPMEEVLSAVYLFTEYRPELIHMILDLLVPDNMRWAMNDDDDDDGDDDDVMMMMMMIMTMMVMVVMMMMVMLMVMMLMMIMYICNAPSPCRIMFVVQQSMGRLPW